MKVLSIVIPTYNMEALLPRCLDSFILSEEYMKQIEVLVVNDGSKDNSSEIAHQYANKYPESIIVIDKSNGNYGSCINAALKIARGKYFRICDADDHYENLNLEKYISYLSASETDIVFSPYQINDFNQNIIKRFSCADNLSGKTFCIDDLDWENDELLKFRAMHCMATKREILIKNKYYQTEGISYTDTQFIFYSDLHAKTCSFYKDIIYIYYLGRDGQTMSKASLIKSYMHFYINAEKMLEEYIKRESLLSTYRARLLELSFVACINYFVTVVLCYLPFQERNIQKLKYLTSLIDKSKRKKEINSLLFKERPYCLWKKYHIPAPTINLLYKIRFGILPNSNTSFQ